jgi:pyruvate formate lyase activating enzyme
MTSPTPHHGRTFGLQRFCLHDGRGIRTTVFLKGCPLSCLWCHNPESQSREPERVWRASRCMACGACVEACHHGALRMVAVPSEEKVASAPAMAGSAAVLERPVLDVALCESEGACAVACPTGATEILGRDVTVEELMEELRRDVPVFDESGGGVTFSGGEPLLQVEFLEAMLLACRAEGIHTTVDTCGHAPGELVERIGCLADAFLFDVKHPDDEVHRNFTGVSNRLILENLGRLTALRRQRGLPEVRVRVPLIAGINDNLEVALRLGLHLAALDPRPAVDLLPYQGLGESKYERMGRDYPLAGARAPTQARLEATRDLLRAVGLEVTIRGEDHGEV